MADEYSLLGAEFTELNPTQIAFEVQMAAEQELPWRNLVSWESFTLPGTVYKQAQAPALSMTALTEHADTGAHTADVASEFTMTARSITATIKAVDVWITKQALVAAQGDLQAIVTDSMRKAYLDKLDTDIVSLYTEACDTSPDHEIGTDGSAIDYAAFLAAYELLAAQAAFPPITWVIGPGQISEVLGISQFSKFLEYGREVLTQNVNIQTGFLGVAPLGVGIYWSNNVVEDAGLHSLMFSKDFAGVRMKQDFSVSVDASELGVNSRSLKIGGESFYGVGGLRDTSTTNKFCVDLIS